MMSRIASVIALGLAATVGADHAPLMRMEAKVHNQAIAESLGEADEVDASASCNCKVLVSIKGRQGKYLHHNAHGHLSLSEGTSSHTKWEIIPTGNKVFIKAHNASWYLRDGNGNVTLHATSGGWTKWHVGKTFGTFNAASGKVFIQSHRADHYLIDGTTLNGNGTLSSDKANTWKQWTITTISHAWTGW
eukprot:SRR837773.26119.p1 GENE.SRR837773.26119~~SRR837773.26119.p1  ORF type:complete len:190 (+),score=58.24 SRR837773.26119:65-634(+)